MQYASIIEEDPVTVKQRIARDFLERGEPDFTNPAEPHMLLAAYPIDVYLTTNYDNFMTSLGAAAPGAGRGDRPVSSEFQGPGHFLDARSGQRVNVFTLPLSEGPAYCSVHQGNVVNTRDGRYISVSAFYMGRRQRDRLHQPPPPREIAYYDVAPTGATGSDNWSEGSAPPGRGLTIYAIDGVDASRNRPRLPGLRRPHPRPRTPRRPPQPPNHR